MQRGYLLYLKIDQVQGLEELEQWQHWTLYDSKVQETVINSSLTETEI